MIGLLGRLPAPEELARLARDNPAFFGPSAQFRARRELEPPTLDEGFDAIERRPFTASPSDGTQRALVIEAEVVRASRRGARAPLDPDDVAVSADRAASLARLRDAGWLLLGTAWLPEISVAPEREAPALAALARTSELLGVAIEWAVCRHVAGPPVCWCRKPLPGLGVAFTAAHDLDASSSVHIGKGPADRGFAERAGFRYADHESFFASPPKEGAKTG
jgi:hypothetical protein